MKIILEKPELTVSLLKTIEQLPENVKIDIYTKTNEYGINILIQILLYQNQALPKVLAFIKSLPEEAKIKIFSQRTNNVPANAPLYIKPRVYYSLGIFDYAKEDRRMVAMLKDAINSFREETKARYFSENSPVMRTDYAAHFSFWDAQSPSKEIVLPDEPPHKKRRTSSPSPPFK